MAALQRGSLAAELLVGHDALLQLSNPLFNQASGLILGLPVSHRNASYGSV
jgi:hypothetical protein